MDLTKEEKQKACQIAAKIAEEREKQFKPDKGCIRNTTRPGYTIEQVYLGSNGDELTVSITLQWTYMTGGCVGKVWQEVHVTLRCIIKPDGTRVLKLVGVHKDQECCSQEQREVIMANTALCEY